MTIQYLLQFLAVVSAFRGHLSKETSCIAMETSNGTVYIVHSITGSTCDFSWINSSNHVLANIGGKIEEVIISSNSTHLHTQGCYETVMYSWDCMSEMSTTATCHVNCTRNAGHPAQPETHPVWLMPVIVASILSLILVILPFVCRNVLRRLKQQRYTEGKPGNLNQPEMTL